MKALWYWPLQSLTRQTMLLLLGTLLSFISIYAYLEYQNYAVEIHETNTHQSKLFTSLMGDLLADPIFYQKHFEAWSIIKKILADLEENHHDSYSMFAIKEVAVLDLQGLLVVHNNPRENPLKRQFERPELQLPQSPSLDGLISLVDRPERHILLTTLVRKATPVGYLYIDFDFSDVELHKQLKKEELVRYLLLSGLAITVIAWIFARWISQPIVLVTAAAKRLGSGDLGLHDIIKQRHDEVKIMARALTDTDRELRRGREILTEQIRQNQETLHKLSDSEARLSGIIELSKDAIISVNNFGKVLVFNGAAEKMLGYSKEEALGLDFVTLLPRHLKPLHEEYLKETTATNNSGVIFHGKRLEVTHRDGRTIPVDASLLKIDLYEQQVFTMAASDVSERVQAEKKLQAYQESLEEKVRSRTQELEKAKEEAEAANRAKSLFLSQMSHELRTPMNAILGFTELLQLNSSGKLDEEQLSYLSETLAAGNHLLELINEVLDLARIESGKLKLNPSTLNVHACIDEILTLLSPLAEKYGVELKPTKVPVREYFIQVDALRFKQIVINLISNAIKYNEREGWVKIEMEEADQVLCLTVRDNGPGIDEDAIERLFQPFERLNADRQAIEGTGIGLTITKQLVELMGGQIGVESDTGEGATFWVCFPLTHDPA